ncbi:hypothetical protein FKM82_021799, partial [Ascaphus truei]
PYWDENTSAEILTHSERESFLEWRRQLAQLEEEKKLILTPFERNLDFWRQLWRVIERSDIVVQIVDARNPLLFRCQDLERYVKEINRHKENIILINKADLLLPQQRRAWAQFFEKEGIKVVFWSALAEGERLSGEVKGDDLMEATEEDDESTDEGENQDGDKSPSGTANVPSDDESDEYEDCEEDENWQTCSEDADDEINSMDHEPVRAQDKGICNHSHLVQKDELLEIFKAIHKGEKIKAGQITVGL